MTGWSLGGNLIELLHVYYDVEQTESEDGDNEKDDDYFSVEPVNIDEEGEEEDQTNCEMNPDVTGAASSTKENLPEGETLKESGRPGDTSSIHSREADENSQKEKTPEREEEVMDSEDPDEIKASCVL